jgi:dihydroneopterin aldolase
MDFIFIEGMLVEANVGIFPRERSAPSLWKST